MNGTEPEGAPEQIRSIQLPDLHRAADEASRSGQRRYLVLVAVRLWALIIAAFSGGLGLLGDGNVVVGFIVLMAFMVAAVAELYLLLVQPERDWYAGRALAESAKTLAWRYAVGGAPFEVGQDEAAARKLLGERLAEVTARGSDRIELALGADNVTVSMDELRRSSFAHRREAYILHRTQQQQSWYSDKARYNGRRAAAARICLLVGEIGAVIAAALTLGRASSVDFAGLVTAVLASIAAWVAIKQFSPLTSAYRLAAVELALQAQSLREVEEAGWARAVSDAEEAISREHTMWLASRSDRS